MTAHLRGIKRSPSENISRDTSAFERLTHGLLGIYLHQIGGSSYFCTSVTGLCSDHNRSPCRNYNETLHIAAVSSRKGIISALRRLSVQKESFCLLLHWLPRKLEELMHIVNSTAANKQRLYRKMNRIQAEPAKPQYPSQKPSTDSKTHVC